MKPSSRTALAVVTNKSWYEGFVPLFIFFAQRACPNSDILVFTTGEIDSLVRSILQEECFQQDSYHLIPKFGQEFGNTPLATKMARWILPLEQITKNYDTLYVGDIDILLAREAKSDLFLQHHAHSDELGIPISNLIRPGSKRLTGLHFVRLHEYMEKAEQPMRDLYDLLVTTRENPQLLATKFPDPGGNEKALYNLVEEADPQWIKKLASSKFRPHHGVHLGLFRNEGRLGSALIRAMRFNDPDMPQYWEDVALELAQIIQTRDWSKLFSNYQRVETCCRQFLEFYLDWQAGVYDSIIGSGEK